MRQRLVMSESEVVVGGIPWVMEVWGAMSWSSWKARAAQVFLFVRMAFEVQPILNLHLHETSVILRE
jgi:hypothetical protein